MSEWKEYKLGEIATFSQGLQVPVEMQSSICSRRQIRFIRIVDITQNLPINVRYIDIPDEKYIIKKGDIVMLRYGYPGVVADNFDGVIANNLFKISPVHKDIYINKYLYYFLKQKTVLDYFDSTQNSTTMPAITFAQVSDLDIILPSIDVQKLIVSVLAPIDEKIDLLNRENATLEAMAETLFRQWFEEKDNEGTLEQLIDIQNGFAFKSKDFIETGTNGVVKIKNINSGMIDVNSIDYISDDVACSIHEKFALSTSDILIAMTGANIGKLGIIPLTNKKLWLNQRVGLIKEKYKGAKYIAYLQLKSEFGNDYVVNVATGSAQLNISGENIAKCGFPVLSENEIVDYSTKIGGIYDKVTFNLGQILKLVELRDKLLPVLMNNEIGL